MTVSRIAIGAAVIATSASIFGTAAATYSDGHPVSYTCTSTTMIKDYVLGARCTARGGAAEQGRTDDVLIEGPKGSFRCDSTLAGDVRVAGEGRVKTLTGYRCRAE
ncbi:hypothetical protein NDR87_31145 [Nocardia sp. CDC159]|uniref:Ig-like domain-containing protein n=1 Tax=Nocardia pulmonis TaxID=2951408 RepID=A0A9X2EC35_9NOCA|nr:MULTISPECIES: hypothetical protein [Nocardia]MCM6777992.1 hypothetical protein [Nocardia pulmonis]MCM6790837.1 hypothetical protein [Nocardia sp. CDC159]